MNFLKRKGSIFGKKDNKEGGIPAQNVIDVKFNKYLVNQTI
jgi:hypothetical protein